MEISLKYLGWDRPGLALAANYLAEKYCSAGLLDLSSKVLVVPGGRAGRRLTELLLERADQREAFLLLPQIITTGALPEIFYQPALNVLSDFGRICKWVEALSQIEPDEIKAVVPHWKVDQGVINTYSLAQYIDRLYVELAAANLQFKDVATICLEDNGEFSDQRWSTLAQLQQIYEGILQVEHLSDLHQARRNALGDELNGSRELILLATADLSPIARQFLEKSHCLVESLVHAPAELSQMFDHLGCLHTKSWGQFKLPLEGCKLKIVSDPASQADIVVSYISGKKPSLRSDQLAIGLADSSLKPFIKERLNEFGCSVHDSSGELFENTPIFTLLVSIQNYLASRTYKNLGSLLRLAPMQLLVAPHIKCSSTEIIAELDKYQSLHYQFYTKNAIEDESEDLRTARIIIDKLFNSLSYAHKPLRDWVPDISQMLQQLLPHSDSMGSCNEAALLSIASVLEDFLTTPLQQQFKLGAAESILLLIKQLRGNQVEVNSHADSIELLGWLELQLDDSPFQILCGFNEGYLPEAVNSDPFLPDSLREKLGLLDNKRRLARDLYALSAGINGREEMVILASRVSANGEALKPSRLLFACEDSQLAKRILDFYNPSSAMLVRANIKTPPQITSMFVPNIKGAANDITSISVTSFRDYLECPFRFYLQHILKLSALNDCKIELDRPSFGNLTHQVLADFGTSSLAASTNYTQIEDFLLTSLNNHYGLMFGENAYPTIAFQRQLLAERLSTFSKVQAKRASEGWQIVHTEFKLPSNSSKLLLENGKNITLTGRIDRIDYHPATKTWAVIDYKTADLSKHPDRAHRTRNTWKNLQLPLYHYLLRAAQFEGDINLGYANLAANDSKTDFVFVEWDQDIIDSAILCAKDCALSICNGEFWPPSQASSAFDSFKFIVNQSIIAKDLGR